MLWRCTSPPDANLMRGSGKQSAQRSEYIQTLLATGWDHSLETCIDIWARFGAKAATHFLFHLGGAWTLRQKQELPPHAFASGWADYVLWIVRFTTFAALRRQFFVVSLLKNEAIEQQCLFWKGEKAATNVVVQPDGTVKYTTQDGTDQLDVILNIIE